MIHDTEDSVNPASEIAFAGHVNRPCVVYRDWTWWFAFDTPTQHFDFVAVAADSVVHERFTHRHVVACSVEPIEEFFNGAASFPGEGGQAQDFVYHPGGLARAATYFFLRRDTPEVLKGKAFTVEGLITIQSKPATYIAPKGCEPM